MSVFSSWSDLACEPPPAVPARASSSTVPPSFRVAALVSVAGMRDSCGNFPVAVCVPARINDASLSTQVFERRVVRVFDEVDSVRSMQEIADRTDLELSDVIAVCFDLVALGVLTLDDQSHSAREPAQ